MSNAPVVRRPNARGSALPGAGDAYPAFLGRGWSFPPTFSQPAGQVVMTHGPRNIADSLWILMSTALGERIMLATYGCDLRTELFVALTPTTAAAIADMVSNAILAWEPRVVVESVEVTATEDGSGWLDIAIAYRIIQTNTRANLVYPYDAREATLAVAAG